MLFFGILATLGAFISLVILILPWQPWRTSEFLETKKEPHSLDLSEVSVLIPARNEASEIGATMSSLNSQGTQLRIVLIDDQSSDRTVEIARSVSHQDLQVVSGKELAPGWAGKLWALEQGRSYIQTEFMLLMDADIELLPGIIQSLKQKALKEKLDFVSLMAELRMKTFWESLLIPAFIYFFKLLYPFKLGNSPRSKIGVGAGGCILLRTSYLEKIGGFGALKGALIDDCSLAKAIKSAGGKTWVGLTHSVKSHRSYEELSSIWKMVARSAFAQLRFSTLLLLGCTFLMLGVFIGPELGIFILPSLPFKCFFAAGIGARMITYLPTLRFYGKSWIWIFLLPAVGLLYLLMTWTSAFRYWFGKGSEWKGRFYQKK